jgi:hypothetical protein
MKYSSQYSKLFTHAKILKEYEDQLNEDLKEASIFPLSKREQHKYLTELEENRFYQALRIILLIKQIFYKVFRV